MKKVSFPTATGARAAYRVLFIEELDKAWDTVVDAQSGAVLSKQDLVKHEAEGTVYENFPGAPKGGTPVVKSFGPTAESPAGYVDPTGLGLDGPTTLGNNASTYANYSNFLVPADQGPRPVSPTSQFNYTYDQNWQKTKGGIVPAVVRAGPEPGRHQPVLAAQPDPRRVLRLRLHRDRRQLPGRRRRPGARPGARRCGERWCADVHRTRQRLLPAAARRRPRRGAGCSSGSRINDAFEGPYSDGNFDASVIEHEYAHGLSTRYVAGGESLGSQQAGSMGEGWGDWYGLNYLHREGLSSKSVVGEYATGNPVRGIRNWAYDANPTNFGDIGYDLTGPEVHADGEIWTATLWELRKKLVAQYGQAEGSEVAARLVTDAMPLSAPDPSFLDMRDAILAADTDRYHGDNTDTIWTVFAHRGAGASATSATGDDTNPQPAFDHASYSRNGNLVGTVVNSSTGAPVKVAGAKVIVGEFEARVTPLVRSRRPGGFGAKLVSGTYDLLVQAPGFGVQQFKDVAVTAGQTTSVKLSSRPNLASPTAGASVVVNASSEDPACRRPSCSTTPPPACGARRRRRRRTTPVRTSGSRSSWPSRRRSAGRRSVRTRTPPPAGSRP